MKTKDLLDQVEIKEDEALNYKNPYHPEVEAHQRAEADLVGEVLQEEGAVAVPQEGGVTAVKAVEVVEVHRDGDEDVRKQVHPNSLKSISIGKVHLLGRIMPFRR